MTAIQSRTSVNGVLVHEVLDTVYLDKSGNYCEDGSGGPVDWELLEITEATDMAKVLTFKYIETFFYGPQEDCLVTMDWVPLSPGSIEVEESVGVP